MLLVASLFFPKEVMPFLCANDLPPCLDLPLEGVLESGLVLSAFQSKGKVDRCSLTF